MMTVQEQINALKEQIASLEAQIANSKPLSKVEQFRAIGERKIDEILNGYDELDGTRATPPIDWKGCHSLGKFASEHIVYDGQDFIWPYDSVDDLKNSAEKLLTETLETCLSWGEGGYTGCDDDENYYYYFATTCTGRVRAACRMAFPKSEDTIIETDGLTFELSIEMDGLCDW